ncbi:hypothetical protein [Pseudomonas sp. xss_2]|uniref:hypothetical protein n=1 Tax=Pseudomonas sp. xss_2 TaxID=3367215 RepID=UPI00370BF98A
MHDITISGIIDLIDKATGPADNIFNTFRQNILSGSYQDYAEDSLNKLTPDIRDSLNPWRAHNRISHIKDNEYFFNFKIPSKYFPFSHGGETHLIDSIIGDMFSISNSSIKKIHITQITWPELDTSLQSKQSTPNTIRAKFKLDQYSPLLGFSVKPRLGLPNNAFFERCEEAAKLGFNIIEADTRKILLDSNDLDRHIEFASTLCKTAYQRKHTCAYSINMSNYGGDFTRAIEKISKTIHTVPAVIKIDAGLDSLSRIKKAKEVNSNLIITSYPLIKKIISPRIPDQFFDQVLSHSGIDIMYPGGFVAVPGNKRHYNATEDLTLLGESISRYTNHIISSRFTPTITGGISAGLLHLYYELYGPRIGYFLGGAVATNAKGMNAGAELCMAIVKHAKAQRAKYEIFKNIAPLHSKIIQKIRDETDSEYVIPREFIENNKLGQFVDENWKNWTRTSFDT